MILTGGIHISWKFLMPKMVRSKTASSIVLPVSGMNYTRLHKTNSPAFLIQCCERVFVLSFYLFVYLSDLNYSDQKPNWVNTNRLVLWLCVFYLLWWYIISLIHLPIISCKEAQIIRELPWLNKVNGIKSKPFLHMKVILVIIRSSNLPVKTTMKDVSCSSDEVFQCYFTWKFKCTTESLCYKSEA